MHTWYRAVCDAHKEMCHVLVKSNFWVFDVSKSLLGDSEHAIHEFLERHYGCGLRLIWRDDQAEAIIPHITEVYHDVGRTSCFCPECKPGRRAL